MVCMDCIVACDVAHVSLLVWENYRSVTVNKQKISLDDLIGQKYFNTLKLHGNKLSSVATPNISIQGIYYNCCYYGD